MVACLEICMSEDGLIPWREECNIVSNPAVATRLLWCCYLNPTDRRHRRSRQWAKYQSLVAAGIPGLLGFIVYTRLRFSHFLGLL